MDAWSAFGFFDFDLINRSVGMGAAKKGRLGETGQVDIVGEPGHATQQRRVFNALDALADHGIARLGLLSSGELSAI